MTTKKLGDKIAGAVFSECMNYRYALWRRWNVLVPDEELRRVAFVMLNPSTATHEVLDPTITRCLSYATDWGYVGFHMLNIFAWRDTDPKLMKKAQEPIGPENGRIIREVVSQVQWIVCCWGTHGAYLNREKAVLELLAGCNLAALKVTKGGHPQHPLYLSKDLQPTLWRPKS
jgi:hypothetical protein